MIQIRYKISQFPYRKPAQRNPTTQSVPSRNPKKETNISLSNIKYLVSLWVTSSKHRIIQATLYVNVKWIY